MKSFEQFILESVNIAGDFTGNLYINSQNDHPQQVGEEYVADVMWQGSLYRLELRVTGGEPLMSGETWKLLAWFQNNRGKSKTRLALNSNLGS